MHFPIGSKERRDKKRRNPKYLLVVFSVLQYPKQKVSVSFDDDDVKTTHC